jgi:hypothetical protein
MTSCVPVRLFRFQGVPYPTVRLSPLPVQTAADFTMRGGGMELVDRYAERGGRARPRCSTTWPDKLRDVAWPASRVYR